LNQDSANIEEALNSGRSARYAISAVLLAVMAAGVPSAKAQKRSRSVAIKSHAEKAKAHKGAQAGHGVLNAKATRKRAKRSGSGRTVQVPAKRLTRAQARAAAAEKARLAARSAHLKRVFVATSELRPMAQQLTSYRSPAAYAAVLNYAKTHAGAAGATAYLALGHAYTLDHRYDEATGAYRLAAQGTDALDDYTAYLAAEALMQANRSAEIPALLDHFADRYPESIFTVSAPLLIANAYLKMNNGAAAAGVLQPLLSTPEASHVDFRLALAKSYQQTGDTARAASTYRSIYVDDPLSYASSVAHDQLAALGVPLSAAQRKVHADKLFDAHHYGAANEEYNALRNDPGLSQADRDALLIYSAVTQLKLKHLSRKEVDKLPATSDDTAALKLYLYAELSRSEKDSATHDGIIAQMLEKYPTSRWFEEALYSGGNMYLLSGNYSQALYHYKLLADRFPHSIYAPSAHWREAWLNYRLGHFDAAAELMEEQVTRYGGGLEVPSALYWRGRIYEAQEHNFAEAASYYRCVAVNFTNYYYGGLARERIAVLGEQNAVPDTPAIASVHERPDPDLTAAVPEDDPHFIKAKLLANAALNEYIGPEIDASPDAEQWGALAEAQIYASYGEYTRALQSMKHAHISFFALPTADVPMGYWNLLLPKPYWSDLVPDSQCNGLDPYLVASLIRQESEFNAGAVSPAHAYGLMQLLPSVGKANAKKEGIRHFSTADLLNPATNLKLGTRNLKAVLDRFGGQPEYALAAYNAGDVPVRQWMALGGYRDIAEFVESIPFSETRGYVEAIMRNRDLYRQIYAPK
jgi:soluble lytic murein transglycosylase